MIPYMVGKLAPNSSHLTRGLVKSVSGRSYFRAVPPQNGDKHVTPPPPPPIVELVARSEAGNKYLLVVVDRASRSTIGEGGDVTNLSPFSKGTARK